MARESNQHHNVSYPAGGDLSAKQFHFVKLNSSRQVVICAAVTDLPIGVLQNNPASGETAVVCPLGRTKVVADEELAVGDRIGCSSDAQAQVVVIGTETTVFFLGQVDQAAGAAGNYATAWVNCINPGRAD